MKTKLISFISIIILIFNVINMRCKSFASSTSDAPDVYTDTCLLMDYDTSKILYEKNGYTRMYPASTTKLMTAIIVLDKFPDLSNKVNISYYAVHSVPYSYSIANLIPGESFTLKDLLYALMVPSANDAAYALAEYVANGGNNYSLDSSADSKAVFENSIARFADLMNQKAEELGCLDTHFVNPNGIHNDDHYSTAYDLTLIGKHAYSNSVLKNIANTLSYKLSNSQIYTSAERVLYTTNALLKPNSQGYYQYADGLKTGYTDTALECLVASAKKDDRSLIATVLNSPQTNEFQKTRESDCIKLFEYGFNNYTSSVLLKKGDVVRNITIFNGKPESKSLNLIASEKISFLIKTGEVIDVTPTITINKYFGPIAEGEAIGTITYTVDGISYTSDLLAEHDVEADDYMYFIWITLVILALVFFIFTLLFHKKHK